MRTEGSPYRWDNPGYVSYMQSLERALLQALADADVRVAGASVLDVGCGSGYFLHRCANTARETATAST